MLKYIHKMLYINILERNGSMKYNCFKDKVAFITGSTSGFGKATAMELAKNGAIVILNYNNDEKRAQKVVEEISNFGTVGACIKADISKEEDILKIVSTIKEKYGKLDYLVNNAAIDIGGSFEEFPIEDFKKEIDANLIHRFYLIQQSVELMRKSNQPRIVNVASRYAERPLETASPLCISEAGTVMLTKVAALELAKFNIKVNTVSPALAITPLTQAIMKEEDFENYAKINPSGRVCDPQDVANTILFLLSNDADYINGENVNVNGGILLK